MKPVSLTPNRLRAAEIAFWLALAASFFVLPDQLTLMSQILVFGLFAVSLDMALGYAGILTVGHAAFFGAGAYTAGLLARHGWGEPFSGLLAALAVCLLLGYALSYLVVRGADLTRLMITIGVCVLFYELANRLAAITGGTDGLQGMSVSPLFGRFEFDLFGRAAFCYTYAIVLATFLLVRLMLRSPFGLTLRGIHDNRRRMLAIGSPVPARLRMAYAFSAAVAGVAGALLAQTTQFVGIESIGFNRSAEVLIILVLGGAGRLYGGLVGAIVYMLLHDAFSGLDPEYWMFWLGVFLIAAVMIGRGGIMGALARCTRRPDSSR
ncbi:MAG: branched-chain amino acid ABC transporter permease [Burkholderiaceae bacterium]|jgi:branched-chain amino acid transport system permease protein|nr:branched-chain amino acid ABC transporter permease [Burkholderiaceae bacterium]